MRFRAEINVMPLKALLDPQGKAITASMKNLHLEQIGQVRVGKHISLEIEAESLSQAEEITGMACRKLLANPIMEYYEFEIFEE